MQFIKILFTTLFISLLMLKSSFAEPIDYSDLVLNLDEIRANFEKVRKEHKGFSFRGILMDKSLDSQMFSCEGLAERIKIRDIKEHEDLKAQGKRAPLKIRSYSMINEEITDVCYSKSMNESFSIDKLSDLGFETTTTAYILDDNVGKLVVSMSADDAKKMLELLKRKYGKPKKNYTDIVSNRLNAKFDRFTSIWSNKGCELLITNRAGMVDNGILVITTTKYLQFEKTREAKKAKQGLDNL